MIRHNQNSYPAWGFFKFGAFVVLSLILYHSCGSPDYRPGLLQQAETVPLETVLKNPSSYDGELLLITDCRLRSGFFLHSRGVYRLQAATGGPTSLAFSGNLLPFDRGSDVEMLVRARVWLDTDRYSLLFFREIRTFPAEQANASDRILTRLTEN